MKLDDYINELGDYIIKNGKKKTQVKPIPYEIVKEKFPNYRGNFQIEFKCENCGKIFYTSMKNFFHRKYYVGRQICKECILKLVCSSDEWRQTNSKAQLIAQNKPEVKAKMSISVKASKTPEVLKKHSIASIKNWSDKSYRDKHRKSILNAFKNMNQSARDKMIHKNGYYSGWYLIGDKKLFFNSSWELQFIHWCEENKIFIERCDFCIPYFVDGVKHNYIPDFVIIENGIKKLVEIKGRACEYVNLKNSAAVTYCKLNKMEFLFLNRDNLFNYGVNINTKAAKFIEKIKDKIINLHIPEKENKNGDC